MSFNFKSLYQKILGINDSPHKIAGGVGLGVFLGIFPGAGPIAAVVLATLLRVNTAAALTGSLLTNSWISVVTFALAVKVGAAVLGLQWQELSEQTKNILKDFHFKDIFDVALFKIAWPLLVGYTVIGFVLGVAAYVLVFWIVSVRRRGPENQL